MTAPSVARDGYARKCCNQRGVAGLAPDLCLRPTDLPIDVGTDRAKQERTTKKGLAGALSNIG
jgi:hypothetical protein